MNTTGPVAEPPPACTLAPGTGAAQLLAWRAFNEDYLLETGRTETSLVMHYTKVDDSTARLSELVAVERVCCSFVEWTIDDSGDRLLLIVTGSPDQLAALSTV